MQHSHSQSSLWQNRYELKEVANSHVSKTFFPQGAPAAALQLIQSKIQGFQWDGKFQRKPPRGKITL